MQRFLGNMCENYPRNIIQMFLLAKGLLFEKVSHKLRP